jgi:cytoskeleton protein RodZ
MTDEQPKTAGQAAHPAESINHDLFGQAAMQPPASSGQHEASFGGRLRAARETRQLTLEACAASLRLPVRVLRQLESGEHDGIDYQVYLGGYISKYGRHLGIDEASIQAEIAKLKRAEPELVATGGVSHSRYLLERYATAATYVVLTAVIVVPMVWLGLSGTLDRDMAHLAPLDSNPVAQQEVAASNPAPSASSEAKQADLPVVPVHVDPQPLIASMIPSLDTGTALPAATSSANGGSEQGSGAHALALNLANPSWVEVIGKDGARLEYGLLPAGSKTYHSDGSLDVRIGNATAAQVQLDGQPVALDGYRHSNVAHFRILVQDGKAAAASL